MVVSLKAFAIVTGFVAFAAAECTNPSQRRAWHTFSNDEKLEYLEAELCLMALPTRVGLPGCRTLFDELQANHQIQARFVHGTGAFLPYHRLLMHTHELILQTECGYTGAQP
jgi:tyrosinase